jgi:hypothetical protein
MRSKGEEGTVKSHDSCITTNGYPSFETSKVSNNDKVQRLNTSLHQCFKIVSSGLDMDTYKIPSHAGSVPPVVLLA